MAIPSRTMQKAYINLEDTVKKLLVAYEHEFRAGKVIMDGIAAPFDVAWM